MRIMSIRGHSKLAVVQLGPFAPWDTGQGKQDTIIGQVYPTGREREQRAVMLMDEGSAGR